MRTSLPPFMEIFLSVSVIIAPGENDRGRERERGGTVLPHGRIYAFLAPMLPPPSDPPLLPHDNNCAFGSQTKPGQRLLDPRATPSLQRIELISVAYFDILLCLCVHPTAPGPTGMTYPFQFHSSPSPHPDPGGIDGRLSRYCKVIQRRCDSMLY